jgi:tRNA dimethylallyltransferase
MIKTDQRKMMEISYTKEENPLIPCVIVLGPTASGKSSFVLESLMGIKKSLDSDYFLKKNLLQETLRTPDQEHFLESLRKTRARKPWPLDQSFLSMPGSIINGDSQQLYKGLALLTASPCDQEKEQWDHLMYNFCSYPFVNAFYKSALEDNSLKSPDSLLLEDQNKKIKEQHAHQVSAYWWAKNAVQCLVKEWSYGRIGWIVGGTGFYMAALLEGLTPLPQISQEKKDFWIRHYRHYSSQELHSFLVLLDPLTGKRLQPKDRQRIQRALIVWHETGTSLSQWHKQPLVRFPICPYIIYLDGDKEFLDGRIQKRLDGMIEHGVMEEVSCLAEHLSVETLDVLLSFSWGNKPSQDLSNILSSFPIGFLECLHHIGGKLSLDQAREKIMIRTRQYAKRQRTWFGRKLSPHKKFSYGARGISALDWDSIGSHFHNMLRRSKG